MSRFVCFSGVFNLVTFEVTSPCPVPFFVSCCDHPLVSHACFLFSIFSLLSYFNGAQKIPELFCLLNPFLPPFFIVVSLRKNRLFQSVRFSVISSIHSVVHPQPLLPKRFHPPREISAPIQHSLPSFLSPSPGNHRFTFCLYGLPHSPFFLKTESETL